MSEQDTRAAPIHLGIPECDLEHEEVKLRTRHLEDAVLRSAPWPEVQSYMDSLLECVLEHFEHEEELLAKVGYPHLREHTRAHNGLLRVLLHLKVDLRQRRHRPEVAVRLIRAWDEDHIRKMDSLYTRYVRDHTET